MKNKIKESGFSEFSIQTINTGLLLSGKNPKEILFFLERLHRQYPKIRGILEGRD